MHSTICSSSSVSIVTTPSECSRKPARPPYCIDVFVQEFHNHEPSGVQHRRHGFRLVVSYREAHSRGASRSVLDLARQVQVQQIQSTSTACQIFACSEVAVRPADGFVCAADRAPGHPHSIHVRSRELFCGSDYQAYNLVSCGEPP